MKRRLLLLSIGILFIFSAMAENMTNLYSTTKITTDNRNHLIQITDFYDSFEEKETLLCSDYITNTDIPDVNVISITFGIDPKSSLRPEIMFVHIYSSEWYFLNGNIALKFPSGIIKLNGKTNSEMTSGDDLKTWVVITQDLTDMASSIDMSSNNEVIIRIYTKEKNNIDIAIPNIFFQEAFSLTKDEFDSLKRAKGIL